LIKTKGKNIKNRTTIVIIIIVILIIILIRKPFIEKHKKPRGKEIKVEKVKKEKEPEFKIAVIIDDVGYPSKNIEAFLKFKGKLTFSVLPFQKESKRYSEILKNNDFEIMVHIPMQPLNYPEINPGKYAILSSDVKVEVDEKLNKIINDIPYAEGANNHMGSKATQDKDLMWDVLEILKNRRMFFIDSLTTSKSCAYDVALKLNIPTSKRDIFLDNEDSFSYINNQFEKLKDIAKAKGKAVGIGHFSKKNTIKVLNYQLQTLKNQNFRLIFASEAVDN